MSELEQIDPNSGNKIQNSHSIKSGSITLPSYRKRYCSITIPTSPAKDGKNTPSATGEGGGVNAPQGPRPTCCARLRPRQQRPGRLHKPKNDGLGHQADADSRLQHQSQRIHSCYLHPSHHGSCQDALAHLPESISAQPPLIRIHQVEEDGRGELMELPQDIPSGWESCDLENPREELWGGTWWSGG